MENIAFLNKRKSIFGNKIIKVAFGLCTRVAACVREPKHAYASTFLRTQLGFHKHKKNKFSTITVEIWNESNIVWESFRTPFFPLYKALHSTILKHTEIPRKKPKIHQKIVNQKGVFHKTPSSQFYLIGTFSGPNPFSLTLLITFLLVCEQI